MNRLKTSIDEYLSKNPIRFHVPSHKGRMDTSLLCPSRDITELDFSDNMNHPQNILRNEELIAAQIFGVKQTFFSLNGATAGVMASILYAVYPGETLILPTDSHISAYYGAVHANANLVRCVVKNPITGITLEEVRSCVKKYPNAKAFLITNPTYYGFCCDINAIVQYLKQNQIFVIVDESHGTHFHFSNEYPISAIDAGADVVIHSGHKTINGLTQTGLVHINSDEIDTEHFKTRLCMLSSTSPSYLLIQSLINAVDQLKNIENLLYDLKLWYNQTQAILSELTNFTLLNHPFSDVHAYGYDALKLCIGVANGKGRYYSEQLETDYGIFAELTQNDIVLMSAGLGSVQSDYIKLHDALKKCDRTQLPDIQIDSINETIIYARKQMPIATALYAKYEYIPLDQSLGHISAEFISVYPPGAPVILPGDILDEDVIKYIQNVPTSCLIGLYNGTLKVVKQ
ncbi:MAG: aminotransferase class I/II-fold pyridoxal phosphate-dependent enzyme [Anaerofustis sp.]